MSESYVAGGNVTLDGKGWMLRRVAFGGAVGRFPAIIKITERLEENRLARHPRRLYGAMLLVLARGEAIHHRPDESSTSDARGLPAVNANKTTMRAKHVSLLVRGACSSWATKK